jgi:hypothetical protein
MAIRPIQVTRAITANALRLRWRLPVFVRSLTIASSLFLAGCPPEKPPEVPAPPRDVGQEGEPCAVGDRVVRACAVGLACTPMQVTPPDPKDRHVFSPEGGGCGGPGDIACGEGLACLMNDDEALDPNAMGICKTQSVCLPAATESVEP